jgi:hypothetical protein
MVKSASMPAADIGRLLVDLRFDSLPVMRLNKEVDMRATCRIQHFLAGCARFSIGYIPHKSSRKTTMYPVKTIENIVLKSARSIDFVSTPSIVICRNPRRKTASTSCTMVVFSSAVGPTMATFWPGCTSIFKS